MARRRLPIGPGPVFGLEWRAAARRWQTYGNRAVFGSIVLLAVWAVWSRFAGDDLAAQASRAGLVGPRLYAAFTLSQLALVALAAPAATAGAICQEKLSGSLTLLFATDLSDREIVVGKLAARLAPVFALMICGLPVLMICTMLGGIDPQAVLGAYAVTAGMALVGCALAMALSVWARKTHGVLMGVYFLLFGWLVVLPVLEVILFALRMGGLPMGPLRGIPLVIALFNPAMGVGPGSLSRSGEWHPVWLILEPYWAPGTNVPGAAYRFLGGTALAAAGLAGLAVYGVRRVHLGQLGRPTKATKFLRMPGRKDRKGGRRGWLPGPGLDRNPVLWREWHKATPSLARRMMWEAFFIFNFVLYLMVFADALGSGRVTMACEVLPLANGFAMGFGLLLLSVTAATGLAEERARGSLDVLMTTTLPTRAIVMGKWLGTARGALTVSAMPMVATLLVGYRLGRWGDGLLAAALMVGWQALVVSLGLYVATRVPAQGRAVAITVAGYLMLAAGWPLMVVALGLDAIFRHQAMLYGTAGDGLLMQAPWYGAQELFDPRIDFSSMNNYVMVELESMRSWLIFWTTANLGAAGLLLVETLRTFNRRLGRMDERSRPRPAPGRVALPTPVHARGA